MTDAEIAQLTADLHAATSAGHGARTSRSFGHAVPGATVPEPAPTPTVHYAGVPSWLGSRPFLTADYPTRRPGAPPPALPIGSLPVEVQEAAVMDDLLYLMVGVEGK